MLTGILALIAGLGGGWLAGRLHLKSNQLKALNQEVGLPVGTLEGKANDAAAQAIAVGSTIAASKAAAIIASPSASTSAPGSKL